MLSLRLCLVLLTIVSCSKKKTAPLSRESAPPVAGPSTGEADGWHCDSNIAPIEAGPLDIPENIQHGEYRLTNASHMYSATVEGETAQARVNQTVREQDGGSVLENHLDCSKASSDQISVKASFPVIGYLAMDETTSGFSNFRVLVVTATGSDAKFDSQIPLSQDIPYVLDFDDMGRIFGPHTQIESSEGNTIVIRRYRKSENVEVMSELVLKRTGPISQNFQIGGRGSNTDKPAEESKIGSRSTDTHNPAEQSVVESYSAEFNVPAFFTGGSDKVLEEFVIQEGHVVGRTYEQDWQLGVEDSQKLSCRVLLSNDIMDGIKAFKPQTLMIRIDLHIIEGQQRPKVADIRVGVERVGYPLSRYNLSCGSSIGSDIVQILGAIQSSP